MTTSTSSTSRRPEWRPHSEASSTVIRAASWLAGLWTVAFGVLAALALLDRTPPPWSPTVASALGGLTEVQVSWGILILAVVASAAGALGALDAAPHRIRAAGWVLVGCGLLVAVLVSDVRALAFLGYLPMVVLAGLGLGPAAGQLEWGVVTDSAGALGHAVGGVALVAAGTRLLGRAAAEAGRGPLSWDRWARWGRPAVGVAVLVPLCYAATRIAWAIDVPFGISREMLDDLGAARYAGLGLALFAVAGAWLTTGLVARWGEVFWSWVPRLGGRRVPVSLALVPGLFVAGAVTSAGLSFWRALLAGDLGDLPGEETDWGAWAPELLWPVWGIALAVACLAYLGRRTERTA